MSGAGWAGVAVAGVTAAYALASRRLASTPLSAPIVFVGAGIATGPVGLDLISAEHDRGPLLTLLEAALTLVLFTDAMAVRPEQLRTGAALPVRLLGIGLALSIASGWLLAWPLLPGLTGWEAALVGAVLAPTDAALGADAIANPRVPGLVRQGLNVESGLNDGMVLPFFVLFLAAIPGTAYAEEGVGGTFWRALLLSTVLGLAVGGAGGRLLRSARDHGWITRQWRQILVLAIAAAAYALATVTRGSGFIAAWVAGFAFAYAMRGSGSGSGSGRGRGSVPSASAVSAAPSSAVPVPVPVPDGDDTADFAEDLGNLLAMLSLLVFGAVLLGPALEHLGWGIVGYAVLSLTVVRMVPVALSLVGTGLKLPTVAYIGWFGPRGLASIVLGLLVAEQQVPGVVLVGRVVAVTVGLSVLLHGVSAMAFSDRYGRWYERAAARDQGLRESIGTSHAIRRRRLDVTGPPGE